MSEAQEKKLKHRYRPRSPGIASGVKRGMSGPGDDDSDHKHDVRCLNGVQIECGLTSGWPRCLLLESASWKPECGKKVKYKCK